MHGSDITPYALIGIVAAAILFLLILKFVQFLNGFAKKLRYLNNEIQRTRGGERKYWERQRRKLWWSLIPFVRY